MSSRVLSLLVVTLFWGAMAGLVGCSDAPERPISPVYKTGLAETERNSSSFKEQFPQQYTDYLRNNETGLDTATKYKASFAFRKNDNVNEPPKGFLRGAQPYLKNLWLGYPFSWEYNEARGHTYAVADILHIDRINSYGEQAGLPATCWNCKTTKVVDWEKEKGDAFWASNFNEYRDKVSINPMENSISCDTCHDPQTMDLRITSIPLQDALERQGIKWQEASRNEMRAYVCGQCHVEYYFQEADHGVSKKPVFPWDNGKNPQDIYTYYNDKGPRQASGEFAQFADWVHPVSKAPMLKAQHPEFETWYDGPHGAAGVSCADCHMPYMRAEDNKKISKHQWISPLRSSATIDNACGQCHSDKTADYLRERVQYTQDKVYTMLIEAQDLSVKAHEAVRRASEWGGPRAQNYDELMAKAREAVRKSQFFWDFVSAENSIGFHNPAKAMATLDQSKAESNEAITFACSATEYGIAKELEGDIRTLVPPLLEWSRTMQMNPENLENHIWTKYLKVLPASDRVWDGQEHVSVPVAPEVPVQPAPEVPVQPAPEVLAQPAPEVSVQPAPEVPVQPAPVNDVTHQGTPAAFGDAFGQKADQMHGAISMATSH